VTRLVRRAAASIALVTAAVGATVAMSGMSSPASAATSTTTLENQVRTLINQQRVAHQCRSLTMNETLRTAARAHSADMAAHNNFSHSGTNGSTFVQRAAEAGYTRAMAENIAWGFRTPAAVVDAWMNSPVHRTNILNCAEHTSGIGLAYKSDGTPYWTQDFGRD
jgi:uncharacterized protein YkwD